MAPANLVRIDQHRKAILVRLVDDGVDIVQVCLIVDAGSGVLDGLPGHQETQAGQTPLPQAREMLIRLLQGKRPSDKRDGSVLKESLAHVCSAVGTTRYFRATAEIDPAQYQCSPVFVFEVRSLDRNHSLCVSFQVRQPVSPCNRACSPGV